MKALSRRTMLRGMGVSVALPVLDAMVRPGRSEAQASRVCFVPIFESNGYMPEHWIPQEVRSETEFKLNRVHTSLEAYKNDLVIISGLDDIIAEAKDANGRMRPGTDHMRGFCSSLTGATLQPGTLGESNYKSGFPATESVDQAIAKVLGRSTKLKSLELGVLCDKVAQPETRWVYADGGQPLPPESNPIAAFGRLFGTRSLTTTALARQLKMRGSVLDALRDDYESLRRNLPSGDIVRIDAHLTAIREVEQRLSVIAQSSNPVCQAPAAPTVAGVNCSHQNPCPKVDLRLLGQTQMDLLVLALTCDVTRVASLQWGNCGNRFEFPFLNLPVAKPHHTLGHEATTTAAAVRESMTRISTWYAEQFAYLLKKMKAVNEGSRTLLDNSLVLYVNELSNPERHSHNNVPRLLAGRAGGRLRTGRFLNYGSTNGASPVVKTGVTPSNNLLVSCLNLMGIESSRFGSEGGSTGPLSGL